jgi:hypothetical protein
MSSFPLMPALNIFIAVVRAVIRQEDHNRVVPQTLLDEHLLELAHVLIDVGDHPVKAGLLVGETRVGLPILLWNEERRVRRIGRDVAKNGSPDALRSAIHRMASPKKTSVL